jgi:hypothetical protein
MPKIRMSGTVSPSPHKYPQPAAALRIGDIFTLQAADI